MTAIEKLESKGYSVVKSANTYLGILNEKCPVVYDIYNPDSTRVYGSNSCSPETLQMWADTLPDANDEREEDHIAPALASAQEADRKAKEIEWDNLYNEGKDGYNPYRA